MVARPPDQQTTDGTSESPRLTLNTRAPQGYIPSPLLPTTVLPRHTPTPPSRSYHRQPRWRGWTASNISVSTPHRDLSWSCHINTPLEKARQRLYRLRRRTDLKLSALRARRNVNTWASCLRAAPPGWEGWWWSSWLSEPSEQPSLTCRTFTGDADQRPRRLWGSSVILTTERCLCCPQGGAAAAWRLRRSLFPQAMTAKQQLCPASLFTQFCEKYVCRVYILSSYIVRVNYVSASFLLFTSL